MKKFKLIVGAVALFAIMVVNVWNAATVNLSSSELEIRDMENVANGFEWSDIFGFLGSNFKSNYETLDCTNFDYSYFYSLMEGGLGVGSLSIPLNCNRGGIHSVERCGSGNGDCLISQSMNCEDW